MNVHVRDVRLSDALAITEILNPIIAAGRYTVLDALQTEDSEQAFLAQFPARGVFSVAEDPAGGKLLGFQTLEPFAAYTLALSHVGVIGTYVGLEHRRQGIGAALSRYTLAKARTMGYEKLFTFVRADNHEALRFYLGHLGFSQVGVARRQARIGTTYVDEVMIERFL